MICFQIEELDINMRLKGVKQIPKIKDNRVLFSTDSVQAKSRIIFIHHSRATAGSTQLGQHTQINYSESGKSHVLITIPDSALEKR